MRSGKLDTPADMLELGTDLRPCRLDWIYCGIATKESGDTAYPAGIRNPAKVEIRAWWDARLVQGRYLRTDSRLFHIDSARDFTGRQSEIIMTATEFVGEPAEYRPADGLPVPCRVFLVHQAPYLDEQGRVTDYRIRAEVVIIETGRIQVDDQLHVAGQLYNVIAYASDTDDGIVRGLWLEAVDAA